MCAEGKDAEPRQERRASITAGGGERGESVGGGRTEAQRGVRAGCGNRWENSRSVNVFIFIYIFFLQKMVLFIEARER